MAILTASFSFSHSWYGKKDSIISLNQTPVFLGEDWGYHLENSLKWELTMVKKKKKYTEKRQFPPLCSCIPVCWLVSPVVGLSYRSWALDLCLSRSNHHLRAHSQQWWSLLRTSIDIHLLLIHHTHTHTHLTPERFVCVGENILMHWRLLGSMPVNTFMLSRTYCMYGVCVCVCDCVCVWQDEKALTAFSTQQIRIRGALIVGIRSRDPIDL